MSTTYLSEQPCKLADFVAMAEGLGFTWMTMEGTDFLGHEKSRTALHGLEEWPCSDGKTHLGFTGYIGSPHAQVFGKAFDFVNEHSVRFSELLNKSLDEANRVVVIPLLLAEGWTEAQAATLAANASQDTRDDFTFTSENGSISSSDDAIYILVDDGEMATIPLYTHFDCVPYNPVISRN